MRFRGRSRGPGPSSSGMKPALRAAAFVDGTPRHFRPPLPRRPGLDQPRLPPTTLEDCPTSPRKTRTTCGNTREPMNKLPALVLRSIRFRPARSISTGQCARCLSGLCVADACGGGVAVVSAIGDRSYCRALLLGTAVTGMRVARSPYWNGSRASSMLSGLAHRGSPSRCCRTLWHGALDRFDGGATAPRITIE